MHILQRLLISKSFRSWFRLFFWVIFLVTAISNANAQLSIQNAGGTVAVAGYGNVASSTGTYGTLVAAGPMDVTFTYLGSQAGWFNSFSSGGNTFLNQNAVYANKTPTAIGSSFTTYTSGGALSFTFSTLNNILGSVSNGQTYSYSSIPSFAISPGGTINGVKYSYILDFKDTYTVLKDYNNMLIGVNAVAAPELNGSALPMGSFVIGSLLLIGSRKRKFTQI